MYKIQSLGGELLAYDYPVVPTSLVEKAILLPVTCFCIFVKNQFGTLEWLYFWTLFSPLIYGSIPPLTVPYYVDYVALQKDLISCMVISPILVFLVKIVLTILGAVPFHQIFRISLSIFKKKICCDF